MKELNFAGTAGVAFNEAIKQSTLIEEVVRSELQKRKGYSSP